MKKIIILFGALGLSLSPIIVRYSDADVTVLAFYRMAIACLLLLPALLRNKSEPEKLTGKEILLCALSGVCFGFHLKFSFMAISQTSIAAATVLIDTEIFFVAAGESLLRQVRMSLRMVIGILLAFAGSMLIASHDMGGTALLLIGDLWAVLAAAVSAGYTLIGKRCRKNISTTAYTWMVYFFAMITLGTDLFVRRISFVGYGVRNYFLALGLAVVPTLLGHSVFSWGLKYESAAYVSLVKLLEPVFATLMGIFFFREYPAGITVGGGLVVILGIIVFILEENKQTAACS